MTFRRGGYIHQDIMFLLHRRFYPDGGTSLQNARFYGNFAALLTQRIARGESVGGKEIEELSNQAYRAERKLAHG